MANWGDAVRRAALREDAGEEVTERWGVEVEGVRWVPVGGGAKNVARISRSLSLSLCVCVGGVFVCK